MSIQSVDRALDILALFSTARPRLGITDIAKELDLRKPTVHGIVTSLVDRGFLVRDPETRKYGLGLKIYELGTILAGTLKINRVGNEPARQLSEVTGLMSRIAIWDRQSALITLNILPQADAPRFQQLGPRIPAYCSGVGKAILAFLSEDEQADYIEKTAFYPFTAQTITEPGQLAEDLGKTRKRGFAEDREEFMIGIACMAAPVFDHRAAVIASLSISGLPDQVSKNSEADARSLMQAAMEISRGMGFSPEALVL